MIQVIEFDWKSGIERDSRAEDSMEHGQCPAVQCAYFVDRLPTHSTDNLPDWYLLELFIICRQSFRRLFVVLSSFSMT